LRQNANTAGGHRALMRALRRDGGVVRVVLEATGLYGLEVALTLSEQPWIEVMVAYPRAVRHFAQSLMQLS
jgi:transposase